MNRGQAYAWIESFLVALDEYEFRRSERERLGKDSAVRERVEIQYDEARAELVEHLLPVVMASGESSG